MNNMTIVDIINMIIGISGVIVGIIGVIVGGRALSKVNKLEAKEIINSNINQAENITIVNLGSDTYAIMKIAKDITQKELTKVVERMTEIDHRVADIKAEQESMPRIHVGKEPPPENRKGDFWFHIVWEDNDENNEI